MRTHTWNDEKDAGVPTLVIATEVATPPEVVTMVSAVKDPSGAVVVLAVIVQLVFVQVAVSNCSEYRVCVVALVSDKNLPF